MNSNNELYIGLDVGTNSVGFAATDSDFNLLRLKGKTVWGTRIFSDANSAQERKIKRSLRRRKARRKYRIYLLNKLFANLINKVDNTFFIRLEDSTLWLEDKRNKNPYLFLDKNKEKEYYKNFPTIWHLRNSLYNNDKKAYEHTVTKADGSTEIVK